MTTAVHALHPHFAAQRLSLRASVRIAFRRADGRFHTRRFGFIVSAWIVPGTTIEHRSAGPRLWGPGRPISTTTLGVSNHAGSGAARKSASPSPTIGQRWCRSPRPRSGLWRPISAMSWTSCSGRSPRMGGGQKRSSPPTHNRPHTVCPLWNRNGAPKRIDRRLRRLALRASKAADAALSNLKFGAPTAIDSSLRSSPFGRAPRVQNRCAILSNMAPRRGIEPLTLRLGI